MFSIDASWLIIIILGIIILFQLVKFFFEVGERYVIVGVLTILSPLAFAMGGSRNTMDIFKGWARMYGSMCLMLVMNVIFMKMILSAMAILPRGLAVFPWIILIIALARVARKIDSIIARIGLNPAITGDGLGRGFPGMMALMVGKSLLSGMAGGKMGAGKAAAGAAKAAAGAAGTAGAASGFKGGTRPGPSPVNTGAGGGNTPPGTMGGADSINNVPNAGTAGAPVNPPIRNAGQNGAGNASPINVNPSVGANPAGGTPSNPPIGHAGTSPQGKGNRSASHPGAFRGNAGMRGKGGIAVSADDMPERKTGRDSGITQSPPMNVAGNANPIDTGKAASANHPDSSEKAQRPPVGANPANMQTPTGGASGGQSPIHTDTPGNAGQNGGNRGNSGVTPVQTKSQSQSVQQGAKAESNTAVQQGGSSGQSVVNTTQQGAQVTQSNHQNTQNQARTGGNAAPKPVSTQAVGNAPAGKASPVSQQAASVPSPVATQRGKSGAPSPKAATQASKAASKAQSAKLAPKSTPGTAAQTPKTPKPVDLKTQANPPKIKADTATGAPLKAGKNQTPQPVNIGTDQSTAPATNAGEAVTPANEGVIDHE